MKNKKVLIIIVVIIILLIATIIGTVVILKNNDKTTGTEWGDIYVKQIKEISDKLEEIENTENKAVYICGLPAGSKDVSATFLDTDKKDYPELVLFYTHDDKDGFTITYIDDKKEFDCIERDGELQLLYDLEKKQYDYYHEDIVDSSDKTEKIHIFDSITEIRDESTNMQFKESQMENEFKERFIKVDMPEFETFDITSNMNENQIKKQIKKVTKNYKSFEDNIPEETKEKVENEIAEISNKEKDAEEVEKTTENTENLVNGQLLKFGKYEGTSSGKIYTLIINSDKTYQIELPWNSGVKKGNVTIEYDNVENAEHVCFGEDYWGIVNDEGSILSQTVIDFHYVGNSTKTEQNKTQTEVKEQNNQTETKKNDNQTEVKNQDNNKTETKKQDNQTTKDGSKNEVQQDTKAQEKSNQAVEETKKRLEEEEKQTFNMQFEASYKGKQNGSNVQALLSKVVSSNAGGTNKITVEMNGTSTADSTQILNLRSKVTSVKKYDVSFGYDSNGYINKVIIK